MQWDTIFVTNGTLSFENKREISKCVSTKPQSGTHGDKTLLTTSHPIGRQYRNSSIHTILYFIMAKPRIILEFHFSTILFQPQEVLLYPRKLYKKWSRSHTQLA